MGSTARRFGVGSCGKPQTLWLPALPLAPSAPGAKRKLSSQDEERLVSQLEAHPDDSLDQHLARWREEQEVPVSRATLGRAILRLKWTRKKRV